MVLSYQANVLTLDGYTRDFLTSFGFRLGECPAAAVTNYFIHCCCEKGSLLSRPYNPTGPSKFVDITKEEDFTTEKGFSLAIEHVHGPRDSFFYCSPCTGGSAWNRFNAAVARERDGSRRSAR